MPEDAERYAALDLGSNSFHLLLAEFRDQRLVRLHTDRSMVRLAAGLDDERNLDPLVAERALDALRRFRPVMEQLPEDHIRVVGTNTLRAAANADGFLESAEAILGAPIEIISGVEEARLIYTGVMAAASGAPRTRCVIDIGGGSTELVRGEATPKVLQSLFMGCVSYSKRFFADGVIIGKRKNNFRRAVRAARAELQEFQHLADGAEVIGASGSVKSVARVLNGGEIGQILFGPLEELAEKVANTPTIEALDLPNLDIERRPVFAAGLAILYALFAELKIQRMTVSPYAIREGIVYDLAGRLHGGDRRAATVDALAQRWEVDEDQALRVTKTALCLLKECNPNARGDFCRRLEWAARLHEIGLALSHSNMRKLGAYMLEHADLAGFARSEQEHLAHLVRNQRGRIKPPREHYGFHPRADLLLCLRLACILHRDRSDRDCTALHLQTHAGGYQIAVQQEWLDAHPAIEDLLYQEIDYWEPKATDVTLSTQ